jgi:hypothetical protein
MLTEYKRKISQQKEESHNITLQEYLIREDVEVLVEVEDMEDLVEEVEDQ